MNREISDAKVAYQQGSTLLALSTVLAFDGEVARGTFRDTVGLEMTEAQKAQLLQSISARFGASLASDPSEDSGPVAAARILAGALAKGWRLKSPSASP
jgi:hypothetical protein